MRILLLFPRVFPSILITFLIMKSEFDPFLFSFSLGGARGTLSRRMQVVFCQSERTNIYLYPSGLRSCKGLQTRVSRPGPPYQPGSPVPSQSSAFLYNPSTNGCPFCLAFHGFRFRPGFRVRVGLGSGLGLGLVLGFRVEFGVRLKDL